MSEASLKLDYVHFRGQTPSVHKKDKLLAVDISPVGKKPNWRVSEKELLRWMRHRGLTIYPSDITHIPEDDEELGEE